MADKVADNEPDLNLEGKPRKNASGRPPKIDPVAVQKICEALSIGSYIESAAAYGGITKVTLYAWLKAGNRQKRGKYREFLNAVEKAMETGELMHVQNVVRAGTGDEKMGLNPDWKASAWMLERKFPKKWGRKEIVRTESEGSKDGSFNEESLNAILVKELDKVDDERWED